LNSAVSRLSQDKLTHENVLKAEMFQCFNCSAAVARNIWRKESNRKD